MLFRRVRPGGTFCKKFPPESRCGSVTPRLWLLSATILYRVAASLPLGEGAFQRRQSRPLSLPLWGRCRASCVTERAFRRQLAFSPSHPPVAKLGGSSPRGRAFLRASSAKQQFTVSPDIIRKKRCRPQGGVLLRTVLRLLQMLFYEKSIGLGIKCPGQYLLP